MTETLAQQWLAAMVGVSIQFTVLAAVVAAALYLSRSLPPSVRYVVWLVVLARLAIPVGLTSPWGAVPSPLTPSRIAEVPAGGHTPILERVETNEHEAPASAVAAGAVARSRPGPAVSPAVALFLAWGIGVLGLITVQVARSARRRARLRAAMEPLPPEVGRRIDELRAELGLRRAVDARVVRDETIGGPVVQGCVRPRILLPASLVRSWTGRELDAVLLHELIHLRRLDPAARAIANVLQIAYFFHPVVWWVHRRLAEEREKACDDAVVRHLRGDKRNYMKGLLRLVEERAGGWHGMHPELRMAAGRRPLARRLKRMLQSHYDPESARRGPRHGRACSRRRPRLCAFHGSARATVRSGGAGGGTAGDLHEAERAPRVPCGVRRPDRRGRPGDEFGSQPPLASGNPAETGCGGAGGPPSGAVRTSRGARRSGRNVPGRPDRGSAPCPLHARCRRGSPEALPGGARGGPVRSFASLRSRR